MDAKSIFSNWIVKNIIRAAVLCLVLLLGVMITLKVVTKHGKTIDVPDFTNLSVAEATALAQHSGVRIEIADSVFVRRMARGAVYRQDPAAGSAVKEGRRVLLIINAVTPKKVTMPNVVGCSMRQAKAEILSRGLVLGRLIYVSDMATNNVLQQQVRGKDIRPGAQVEGETVVDLVVGLSSDDNLTIVPKVTGLKAQAAVDVIHDYSLNVRNLVYDDSVHNYADSLEAVVYRQSPLSTNGQIRMGSDVTVYLTTYEERMPKE